MKKYIIFLAIIYGFINIGFSQEVIINCGNPVLQKYSKNFLNKTKQAKVNNEPIELPFFDDFSNSYIYPDTLRWTDKHAYINDNYAINPISVGVATLDAIDQYGNIYQHLTSSVSRIADYLTSQPINLNYLPEESIYMSFYYQSGGMSSINQVSIAPKEQDSLVLQFYASEIDEWKSVWRTPGKKHTDNFELVLIPVTDNLFLNDNFQFRFLNYSTIGSSSDPSWQSNTNIWNIDYVKIDKDRSSTDILAKDVAFMYNIKSLLKDYVSVPWKHYYKTPANINLMTDYAELTCKNTWDGPSRNTDYYLRINDYYSGLELKTISGGSINMTALSDTTRKIPINNNNYEYPKYSQFIQTYPDSAKFVVTAYIITDADDDIYKWNDTVKYYQTFYNYYAYDDGTAEAGYGVNAKDACVAYKFTPLIGDTLKGVYMYFNKTLTGANKQNFYLTVWDDNNGYPNKKLQEVEGIVPLYSDELNRYVFYPLKEDLYLNSTFYVGWRNTTSDVLNIGVDNNNKTTDKLFFKSSGAWQASQFDIALMIRPVFGEIPIDYLSQDDDLTQNYFNDIIIYPNPANNNITVSSEYKFVSYEIFDACGQLVLSNTFTQNINTSKLQQGIYYLKLKSDSLYTITKKIVIIR